METQWRADFPGIWITTVWGKIATNGNLSLNKVVDVDFQLAFTSKVRLQLDVIASRPVGRDLLTLISKRCQGVGTSLQGAKCWVGFGYPPEVDDVPVDSYEFAEQAVSQIISTHPSLAKNPNPIFPRMGSVFGDVGSYNMTMPGRGDSAAAFYNPWFDYDLYFIPRFGIPNPPFVALAHELVHALHTLSGDQHPVLLIEEARTVGAGRYANTRISENAIRREHHVALRNYYKYPNDCDF